LLAAGQDVALGAIQNSGNNAPARRKLHEKGQIGAHFIGKKRQKCKQRKDN
jgi:hypothetical protein